MIWKPHVTVAAIVEQDGRFLLVEEETAHGLVLNQPAGHLEPGESLIEAVVRETREETGHDFQPLSMTGIYRWHSTLDDTTFLRICFHGKSTGFDAQRRLDEGIRQALWLTIDNIRSRSAELRSPLVLAGFEDYLAGHACPLNMIRDLV